MELIRKLHRIYRPSVYQGRRRPEGYFEGWYFKLVNADGDQVWSLIPGVSFSHDPHSFIQLIHASSRITHYLRFPLNAFGWKRRRFHISIGQAIFSERGIELDLQRDDLVLQGTLSFHGLRPFPAKLFAPGIMGWYAFVPFMECYHGVVSMQHGLSGSLSINGEVISFDGGKGYIEKDWGSSMPTDWIWAQSNHFDNDREASFMISVARIPWLKGHFPGFLSFLYLGGRVFRFATYNRSRITWLEVTAEHVRIRVDHRKYRLDVEVEREKGGVLKAPSQGAMEREIRETIVSKITVVLRGIRGEVLFSDTGRSAGLEIVGDMEQYL